MQITVQLPDDIAQALGSNDLQRSAMEALALEGYRAGRLGGGQVQRMLGFRTPMQLHAFLKEHGVYLNYSIKDLEQDRATAERILNKDSGKRSA